MIAGEAANLREWWSLASETQPLQRVFRDSENSGNFGLGSQAGSASHQGAPKANIPGHEVIDMRKLGTSVPPTLQISL